SVSGAEMVLDDEVVALADLGGGGVHVAEPVVPGTELVEPDLPGQRQVSGGVAVVDELRRYGLLGDAAVREPQLRGVSALSFEHAEAGRGQPRIASERVGGGLGRDRPVDALPALSGQTGAVAGRVEHPAAAVERHRELPTDYGDAVDLLAEVH